MIRKNGLYAVVLFVGSLQIVGYSLSLTPVRQLGQLLVASPLPLVFSHFRGMETFSPQFSVTARSPEGQSQTVEVDSRLYSHFPGPYARRNVYGAVFAYGAKLTEPNEKAMADAVFRYAFCQPGSLRAIFDQMSSVSGVEIAVRPRARAQESSEWKIEVGCES
jgi:hypothetical protein